jgi:phage virion morphogenesis protein
MSAVTFQELDTRLALIAEGLSGAHGKSVMFAIANELRRRNRLRVHAQQNLDGSPYPPRSSNSARAAAKKKLLLWFLDDKRMQANSGENWAEVGFSGRTAELAAVHQFGQTIKPFKKGPAVRYPIRELIGLRQADKQYVRETLAADIQKILRGKA